ncbi:hypothetical protein VC83_05692 [Pseudogymnoascus destructans]|uniref:Uncharacterized protein n=1 Tax=Pseudogymnoascus destructans TaxID=655981 RepID=A0A177A9A3_9PEZI|nr:uncharacterized protein VC83_05692 [Pseudogymnoascus destructans]OAF57684.1 hypothetical protein VC83_05692 [Pseudogymnoascus destructans]
MIGVTSDLPLRGRDGAGDETSKPPTREAGGGGDDGKRQTKDWTFASSLPAPLDVSGTEGDTNRQTKDWTFASSIPLTVGPEEVGKKAMSSGGVGEGQRESIAEGLIDLDMSLSTSPQVSSQYPQSRASTAESLIDLDMSLSPSPPSRRCRNITPQVVFP